MARFLKLHPQVTAELALTNRPLRMIEEGCDVGILPGKITDESLVARPAGSISLVLAASPSLAATQPAAREPADLRAWPWVGMAGFQFWSAKEVTLHARGRREQTIPIAPVLTSEGVTRIREAVREGLGVSVLPDWLIAEDLRVGRLVRVLPPWKARGLPVHVVHAGARVLPTRVRAFIDYAVSFMKAELASA